MDKNLLEFPVTLYGEETPISSTLSRARCRIFYKYANRNRTYITDEFANKLLKTIPYTPVKGIFSDIEGDFKDHGNRREEGRIYGVVPEQPNLRWEDHEDADGRTRTYACVDVILFTALYKEANLIDGKSQSMELYAPTLKYHEETLNGDRYFVYDEGCFLGLQVLGDDVEPCFEGASFFSLQQLNDFELLLSEVKKEIQNKGGNKMDKNLFKISDEEKFNLLWQALNPDPENCNYYITAIYDEYALTYNMEDGNYYRVYYKKDDEKVSCGEIVKVFMEDVTEAEHQSLETIRALTNNNLESVSETFAELDRVKGEIESLTEEKNELCTKIETKDGELSTLQMEKDTISSQKDSLEQDYNSLKNEFELLQSEKETLENYKNEIEHNQKMAAIDNYSLLLEKEVLDSYKEKVDEFDTLESLEKDLAYNYVKTQQVNNFAKVKPIIPVTNPQQDELTNILNKYKKED